VTSVAERIAVIINPISGTGGRIDVGRARAAYAADLIASQGGDPSLVFLTERPGHARELAKAAMSHGVDTVVAWGGDGTMNEVASALVFTKTAIAMVPSGSGNGLARELKIPFNPAAAFEVACRGREIIIDAGVIDGRFFFNIAGIGLDARVAHRFAVDGLVRRGFFRYLELTIGELRGYVPDQLTVTTAASSITKPVLLVAIANGRQYGNGAIIAPAARLDDGQLDVVIVAHRTTLRACLELPLVFMGRAGNIGGVTMESAESVEVTAPHPVLYHLDGEPIAGTLSIRAQARPQALRVKVPAR